MTRGSPPSALFGLGFPAAPRLPPVNPPCGATRRFILQKARRHPGTWPWGSGCLRAAGFRFCFTPLPGCFSPFPRGTCSLSVARGVQPWRVVPPDSPRVSRVPGYLGSSPRALWPSATGLSPSLAPLSRGLRVAEGFLTRCGRWRARRKVPQHRGGNGASLGTAPVWAPPLSLAATRGISVDFFSSGY